jgi:hypothetical protein
MINKLKLMRNLKLISILIIAGFIGLITISWRKGDPKKAEIKKIP